MAQGPYSDKVMDHFMHPRNMGEIEIGRASCRERVYVLV
jgi:nitrogen fixation NifU-like protein